MKAILTLAVAVLFSAGKAGYAATALDALKTAAPAGQEEVTAPAVPASATSRGPAPAAGNYAGTTARGLACGVKIQKEYDNLYLQIYWIERSGKYQSCGFFPKRSGGSGNFVELSGGSEFSTCSTRLTLDNTGIPVEAKLGIGSLLQFGYDETCADLRRDSTGFKAAQLPVSPAAAPETGEAGSFSGAGEERSRQSSLMTISEILDAKPLPGGCALEVNSYRSSYYYGDTLNVGIIKGGEFTDILMIAPAAVTASAGTVAYRYEKISTEGSDALWLDYRVKDIFELRVGKDGNIASVVIERYREKKNAFGHAQWRKTQAVKCGN